MSTLTQAIEAAWLARAKAQHISPRSAKGRAAECEFFCGAMAALNAAFPNPVGAVFLSAEIPPVWVNNIMSGRPVLEVSK